MEIRFRLAGIPVKILPAFWLVSLLLGWGPGGLRSVFVWIPCVFVGVLCHELGHAIVARRFGGKPEITLYAMGGLTHTNPSAPLGRWRSIAVSLAGAGAGFLLGAMILVVAAALTGGDGTAIERLQRAGALTMSAGVQASPIARAAGYLIWINLGWGAVNLIPVLPFDGGNVMRELLGGGEQGWLRAAWVSVIAGPIVAVAAFMSGWTWAGLLFGLAAVQTGRELMTQWRRLADKRDGLYERMDGAAKALHAGEPERAAAEAEAILRVARGAGVKQGAAHIVAFARVQTGRPDLGLAALEALPPGEADDMLIGVCLLEMGRADEAAGHFEVAVVHGEERARELLEEALEQAGDSDRTREIRARMRVREEAGEGTPRGE